MNGKIIAKILDHLVFSEVIKIYKLLDRQDILPYISEIYSENDVDLSIIERCCNLKKLTLPNSTKLKTKTLFMLPSLESLTIAIGTKIDNSVFKYLPNLRSLQILSLDGKTTDLIINKLCVTYLTNIRYLHLSSKILKEHHFKTMSKLKVLVLNNTSITPSILNILPMLEVCVINKCLYKYRHSLKNIAILQRIGKLDKIKICNIK